MKGMWMLAADLRQALRSVMRTPLFSGVVMLLLALGIGANTLIFTAVDALLLRPLPVARPEQLLQIGIQASPTHVSYEQTYVYKRVLAERARSFSAVFASWQMEMALGTGSRLENITGETVSGNYFAALGLKAAQGRLLTNEDEQHDAPVAVLNHGFWQRAFAGRDPIGKTIRLRGSPFTIVGVLAPGFSGLDLERRTDVWVTMSAGKLWFTKPDNSHAVSNVYLRLRDGVSFGRADAEIRALYPAMVEADYQGLPGVTQQDREHDKAMKPVLTYAGRGASAMRKTFAGAVVALMGAGVALLLLICANVGGLIAARGEAQRHETAIRLSLGASRWSIVRRTMAEALVLSFSGAAGGWVVAYLCGPLLLRFLPQRRPIGIELTPDLRVLMFAALACILTALVVSALPAWNAARTDPNSVIARGGTRLSGRRLSHSLVAFQVAISTVLLTGGFSLVRTLDRLREQDPGFRRQNLIVMTVNPRMAGIKSAQIPAVFEEVVRRAEAVPGAEAVSLADRALMRGIGLKATVGPTGTQVTFADALNASMNGVSLGHFANMHMRILEGRGFRPGDDKAKPRSAVVSRSFATRFFPGGNAIGRTFGTARPGTVVAASDVIVGVVNDANYRSMREAQPPTFYELLEYDGIRFSDGLTLHISTRGDPGPVIQRVRAALASIGSGLVPTDVATMEQEIETSLWQERLLATLASVFAALAAILAGLGLFGMLAYAVSRRTREIGIRLAVGATVGRIAGLVMRDAAWSVVPGMLIGAAIYAGCSRAIASLLYGITALDALSIIGAAAGVTGVCAIGTFFPAMRAMMLQPSQALRDE
jgi:predicted permease